MQYSEGYLLDRRYALERYVGGGSFGEVWVAHDEETDIQVAVKIYISMDEKGLEEFKKEFQLSFELNHTNLLHANYMGVNAEDGRPFLVMPFCPEGSVSRHAGDMLEADIWRFIRDVAAGLAYLHSQDPPIIHQDIKPDNILILKNGDYVITDFGISKQLRQSLRKSAMSLNSAGAISYMGPERFSKNAQAVKASDVWSLGVSVYELATGDLPFCGMGGSMQKQGADTPDLPEEFSERLNMVFTACIAKETWDRPTAAQLRDYASAVVAGKDPEITWRTDASVEAPAVPASVKATVAMTPPPPVEPVAPAEPVAVEVPSGPVEPDEPLEPAAPEVPATPDEAPAPLPEEPAPVEASETEEPAPVEAPETAEPEVPAAEEIPASVPEDNIDAPVESGFLEPSAPSTENKPSFVVIAILAVLGLAAGAGLGLLLL